MGYLDYYKYQATARGVHSLEDVVRQAHERAYVYDRIVLPWLPGNKGSRIAELACGHGSFLQWLKERGFTSVTGVDSSAEQIKFAGQVADVSEADVLEWLGRKAEGSVDVLVGIDLIEHISKDEMMDLLQRANRVLTKGGRLILRYPNGDSPLVGRNLFNDITHVWTYTTNCLSTLAGMHGFSGAQFVDESTAIRDHRWLKVPLSKMAGLILRALFQAATRERVSYWGPHMWACLTK